jgi:SRSO17 transposase
MEQPLVIRGRIVTDADKEFLCSLITEYPERDRLFFAERLARSFWPRRHLDFQQKTSLCLDILLAMEHHGLVNPFSRTRAQNTHTPSKPSTLVVPSVPLDTSPLEGPLRALQPLSFQLVSQPEHRALWNQMMKSHHYLGFRGLVGKQLKYLVTSAQGRPVAALGWESCVWKLKPRDRVIGWRPNVRQRHLHQIANNTRFLIFPWVRVPHLASHILAANARVLSRDWERLAGAPLALLETFVDPQHFAGTCYKAANWIFVGHTKGFSKEGRSFRFHGRPKEVYLYPLTHDFRRVLGVDVALPPLTRKSLSSLPPHSITEEKIMAVWNPKTPPPFNLNTEDINTLATEFKKFHALFQDAWGRVEHVRLSASYLQGLMSSLPRKSMEPIALHTLKPSSVDSLQQFVSVYAWDEHVLARRHKEETAKTIDDPLGVFSVDGSDFPKKGTESVGVARQYCGRLGKIDNCQAGVFIAYSSPKGHALLDRRLFLPQSWLSKKQKARRKKCRVPENITFKTKPQLALEMVQNVRASNLFRGHWVTCDDAFGNSPDFVDHLPTDLLYLADVPCTTRVWLKRPHVVTPAYSGFGRPHAKPRLKKGEPQSIPVARIAQDKALSWHTVTLGEGSKGPRRAMVARLRVVVTRDGLPAHDAWLFIKKSLGDDEIKYALSNAPKDTPLTEMIRVSSLRWPIEQCFQEGKSEIGMGHYEHRSWPAWHRHMTFVFLAQLFLLRIRIRLKKKPLL